ncbi:MAG: SAM-dependent methyltransferase [Myxococcales bacterium]|nr:SAM-dependent methyltransferase [Myxococcales bacterium]
MSDRMFVVRSWAQRKIGMSQPQDFGEGIVSEQYGLILDALAQRPRARLLEVGCGTGVNLDRISRRFPEAALTGLEIHEGDASQARELLGARGRVVVGDAVSMPFADAEFDFVILPHVIEHVRNPNAILREIRRVLAPEGLLQVNTPNWMRTWNLLLSQIPFMQPRLRWERRPGETDEEFRGHLREYVDAGLRATITEAGYTVIRSRGVRPRMFFGGGPSWVIFNSAKVALSRVFSLLGNDTSDDLAMLARPSRDAARPG